LPDISDWCFNFWQPNLNQDGRSVLGKARVVRVFDGARWVRIPQFVDLLAGGKMRLCTKTALALMALFSTSAIMCAQSNVHSEILKYRCFTQNNQSACRELAEDKDSAVRRDLVSNLTDHTILEKIAIEDEDSAIRAEAVGKLTDQAILAKIVVGDKSTEVRKAAFDKLTDQALLVKIAIGAKDPTIRESALDKLTDQGLLVYVAEQWGDYSIRKIALKKLIDKGLLENVEVKGGDYSISKAAVKKLTDQSLLTIVAIESKDPTICKFAVLNLADQALLAKIAREEKFVSVRRVAVEKLTDMRLLESIAKNDKDSTLRENASGRLRDLRIKKLAEEREMEARRPAAISNVLDLAYKCTWQGQADSSACKEIENIAVEDKDEHVRNIAVSNISNLSLLTKIATDDSDEDVRKVAKSKLAEKRKYYLSIAPYIGTAEYISNKVEQGMSGEEFRQKRIRLTINLYNIEAAIGSEKLIQLARTIDEQYRTAEANLGSARTWVQVDNDNGVVTRSVTVHVYNSIGESPGNDEIVQSNLMAARENIESMLIIFYRELSSLPDNDQKEVKEEIQRHQQ
jgi:hypothetical protein